MSYDDRPTLVRYKAKHPYSARNDTELSIMEGCIVEVIDKSNADWWMGRYAGKAGYFPSSYLDQTTAIEAPEAPTTPPPAIVPKRRPSVSGPSGTKPVPGKKPKPSEAPPLPEVPCPVYEGNDATRKKIKAYGGLGKDDKFGALMEVAMLEETKKKEKRGIGMMLGMYMPGTEPYEMGKKQTEEVDAELREIVVMHDYLMSELLKECTQEEIDAEVERRKQERKMQLDMQLQSVGAIRKVIAADGEEKTGVLYKKGTGIRGGWSKRYAVLEMGTFTLWMDESDIKSGKSPDYSLSALTANVKPVAADKPFAFHVIGIDKAFTLACDNQVDADEWVRVLQNATMTALGGVKSKLETKDEISRNPLEQETITGKEVGPILKEIEAVEGNNICVDCFEPKPLWASINLGILICIECSGRHRHLGVHISKVRSFQLDNWEPEVLDYFKVMGNKRVNDILEANLARARKYKPMDAATAAMRDDYILKKYTKRAFLAKEAEERTEEDLSKELRKEVSSGCHPVTVCSLILQGANPNAIDEDEGTGPLHVAAANGDVMLTQALVLNGADVNAQSPLGPALHQAVKAGHLAVAKVLLRNGASIRKKTLDRRDAVDLAEEGSELHTLLTTLSPSPVEFSFPKVGETLTITSAAVLLDVIEAELLPAARMQKKKGLSPDVAAILKKSDLSVVVQCSAEGKGLQAHPELACLLAFPEAAAGTELRDCFLLTPVQPCAMCSSAIAISGLANVVYGWDTAESERSIKKNDEDAKLCRGMFGRDAPLEVNPYYTALCLMHVKGFASISGGIRAALAGLHEA